MTTLVRDIFRRVCEDTLDTDPYFEHWSERFLVDRLNDAQLIIARFLPSASVADHVVRLEPGTRQTIKRIPMGRILVDGVGATADGFGVSLVSVSENMGGDGRTPGAPIRTVSKEMQDAQNPGWHASASNVIDEVMYDPMKPTEFWVCPGAPSVQGVNVWVRINYTAIPTDVPAPSAPGVYAPDGSSTAAISLSDEYRDDVCNYVIARCYMRDGKFADPNKAQTYTGLFMQSMAEKIRNLTGTSPNLKRMPMSVADIGGSK